MTVQVAEAVVPERTQEPLKDPVPPVIKANVAVGVTGVPADEVSMTVTLQEDGVFAVTGLSQVIVVEVVRLFTVILKAVAVELPAWVESPP